MNTMQTVITPALLALNAVLLSLILRQMPPPPPTMMELLKASKEGADARFAVYSRAVLTESSGAVPLPDAAQR